MSKAVLKALQVHEHYTAQALRSLSYSGHGSDIGEVLTTWEKAEKNRADGAEPGSAWYDAWHALANKMEARAVNCPPHDKVSAAALRLRATEYHRNSEFFLRRLDNLADERRQGATTSVKSNFSKYLDLIGATWEFYSKPHAMGFFIESKDNKENPVVVLPSGYDAICPEGWLAGGLAAYSRGYSVCLLDAPGQGFTLRNLENPLYMTPDSFTIALEEVITMLEAKTKGKIALFGRSFAGCLSLRAAGSEQIGGGRKRLSALLLDPPQPSQKKTMLGYISKIDKKAPGLLEAFKTQEKEKFDTLFHQGTGLGSGSWDADFFWESRFGVHNVQSPYDALVLLMEFDSEDVVPNIDCPIWCADNQSENLSDPSLQYLLENAKVDVSVETFTLDDGSLGHCCQGSQLHFNESAYSWLATQTQ